MKSFAEMMAAAQGRGPRVLAVAGAADEDVLSAVAMADREGLVQAVLVGDPAGIEKTAAAAGLDLSRHRVVAAGSDAEAAATAVGLVRQGEAHLLMKGMLHTSTLLKAVVDKEKGLRGSRALSHCGVFEVERYPRLLFLADIAFNIAPDLNQKAAILHNSVDLIRRMGIPEPRVACLSFVETVNPEVTATVEAAALSKMAERGQFGPCLVDGPLAFDLCVSPEAAAHKRIASPVAGQADLILMPDLNTGNGIYKSLVYLAGAKMAGVVLGGKAPVVLVSRADTAEIKLYSIALALLAA